VLLLIIIVLSVSNSNLNSEIYKLKNGIELSDANKKISEQEK
jgi:hypothetical protein